nr:cytochrome P450 CYP2A7 - human [Homo sapiens]
TEHICDSIMKISERFKGYGVAFSNGERA